MKTTVPFYRTVNLYKVRGGKKPLWQAHKPGCLWIGVGNSADNAIADLQKQIRKAGKEHIKVPMSGSMPDE
jgi:3-hydroxyisobutyrate dehydrogenase-like beta-hydroxyacid dehydrogenase